MHTIDEDKEENLWSDLESEFQEEADQPLELELPNPPSRRRTVGVSNLQSLFSGYYPVLLLCLVAGLMGATDWYGPLLSAPLLSAFLLAAVLAPTFRGPRRGWGYYALTALLIGGVSELGVSVSQRLVGIVLPYFAPSSFPISLQMQMESFYQIAHWAIYLGLGIGVAAITFRAKKRVPWMDSPETRSFHKALAGILLAIPLLLPLGCLIVGYSQAERTDWYLDTAQRYPEVLQVRHVYPSGGEVWNRLYTDWLRSAPNDGGESSKLFHQTSVEEVRKVEDKYLALTKSRAPRRGWTSWQRSSVQSLLLARKDDLRQPYEVARSLVEYSMLDHFHAGYSTEVREQWQFLLKTLETRQLDDKKAHDLLEDLLEYEQNYRSVIGEIDNYVLATVVRHTPYYDYEAPEPMRLFGVTFNHSPSQLYFLHYTDYVTRPWLNLREQLLGLSTQEQISRIRQLEDSKGILRSLSLRTFDHELRPLWRVAAVMAASRIYLSKYGSWPSHMSDLGSSIPFKSEFELSQTDGGLKIHQTGTDNAWVLR